MIHASAAVLTTLLALVPGPEVDARCGVAPRHAQASELGRPAHTLKAEWSAQTPEPGQRAHDLVADMDAAPDDELRALYRSGIPYRLFLEQAERRVDLWRENTDAAEGIDAALVARARAVGGTWHVLAVAIDSCSDSVSTLPYLAALADRVDGLDLRIVDPTAGRAVMEAHPTPDGRAATPTMLLLDASYDDVGCFIERPPALQRWIAERPGLSGQELYEGKMAWYAQDAGDDTVRAFVEMMEAAAEGARICR